MTKDEIKRALDCCSKSGIDSCKECPYGNHGKFNCEDGKMFKDILDFINEQDKENEKLEQLNAIQCCAWQELSDENERLVTENNSNLRYNGVLRKENKKLKEEIKQAKIDVLNKLKKKTHNYYPSIDSYCVSQHVVLVRDIDELIREVENEQKD